MIVPDRTFVARMLSVVVIGLIVVSLSGCSFFGDAGKEAQKQAESAQKTFNETVDKANRTINDAKNKVENVQKAAGDLQKSVNDLGNWGQGNGNAK